jgi:hypothetical protein
MLHDHRDIEGDEGVNDLTSIYIVGCTFKCIYELGLHETIICNITYYDKSDRVLVY